MSIFDNPLVGVIFVIMRDLREAAPPIAKRSRHDNRKLRGPLRLAYSVPFAALVWKRSYKQGQPGLGDELPPHLAPTHAEACGVCACVCVCISPYIVRSA